VINRVLLGAMVALWSLACVVLGAAAFPQAHAAPVESPGSAELTVAFLCVDGKAVGMHLAAPTAGSWSIRFDHELCRPAPAPRRVTPLS
jgi:hypothetical protein